MNYKRPLWGPVYELLTVLNTNFKEMLTVNTYTYSQPIEIPANYGKKISIALTIPDDYVFLCVTNIKQMKKSLIAILRE